MSPEINQIVKDAASKIVRWEIANEGEGSPEDMQDAYDHNEEAVQELNRVEEIISDAINHVLRKSTAPSPTEECCHKHELR